MSKEAMKLALEALEQYTDVVTSVNDPNSWVTVVDAGKPAREAIAALREALADQPVKSNLKQVIELYDSPDQPAPVAKPHEQEPVAHQYQSKDGVWRDFISQSHYKATVEDGSWPIRALYTFPPAQRTWVSLTDEEIDELHGSPMNLEHSGALKWVRIIEAKLKDKNNA